MAKPATATLSVLSDLRPVDDTAASIRDSIARALGKRAAAHALRDALAASIPRLTLETDDDVTLDQAEAQLRSMDRDIVRIDALLVELRTRLVPAQHEEKLQRLAVQALHTNEQTAECRAWMATVIPEITRQVLEGARIRLNAKAVHQAYVNALHTSGLPPELAATLPDVAPPLSATARITTTLSGEQQVAAMLPEIMRAAERIIAFA